MKQNFLYYLHRLLPFAIVFFGFEIIEVAATFCWDFREVDTGAFPLIRTIFSVLLETATSFCWGILPFLAFLFVLPRRQHFGKIDKICSLIFFAIFTLICAFTEVSELFFWNEFRARFNFIAVDYLVYTNEVVGNIWQSYPIVPVLAGIVVAAALSGTAIWLKFGRLRGQIPSWKIRGIALLAAGTLCAGTLVFVDISHAEGSGNRYNDELGKNGFYSLFSAFLKNELSWKQFYPTLPDATVDAKIEEEYGVPAKDFRRHISPRGNEKRLNVMFVVMESMSAEFLENGLAPNLKNLAENGIFFSNVYATGTRSVRGLEALAVAIPPLPGMSIVRRDGNAKIETAGTFFRQKNYDTRWIYGGHGVFDNMNTFFGGNGFEICDRATMRDDEISFATIWGVCDEDLFRRAVREADKSAASGTPFFNFVFTTSNHRPFAYPDGKIDIPSKTGRAGAVKYADFAVGELVKLARGRPWFDDTIFVFVADHCASCAGRRELNPEKHKIPLIFYSPKHLVPAKYDFVISQIDALPTLLGLLNFEYDCSFYGNDVLAGTDFRERPRERAFISNYQHIGFLDGNDNLLIMKPVKESWIYRGNKEKSVPTQSELERAIPFFQHAESWRETLRER